MTLAFVLLLCSSSWNAAAATPMRAQSSPQAAEPGIQAAPEKQQESASPQSPGAPSQAKPSSEQAPASAKKSRTKRKHRKKKIAASNCGVRPTPTQPATSATTTQGTSPSDPRGGTTSQNGAGQTSGIPPTAQDCPPPKTIVRHGGTSEPSIQLAGGPPNNQAAQQRNVVNQLLGVTENNLKKVNGKQLSSTQQDTLSQARAFVQQSRTAIADGDLERARTLAWKAETLSEDLIKP